VKLKITLDRPQEPADLMLTAAADATVGDVATALATRDPDRQSQGTGAGAVTLTVLDGQRVTLDPKLPVADSGIRSGARIAVGRRPVRRPGRPPGGAGHHP
jgi:S-DNA-T family DNA segregation ATPase FtsK/SpoIIIE